MYQQVQKEIKQIPGRLVHKPIIKRPGRDVPSDISRTTWDAGEVQREQTTGSDPVLCCLLIAAPLAILTDRIWW